MMSQKKFYVVLLISLITVIVLPLSVSVIWAESKPSNSSLPTLVQSVVPQNLEWKPNPNISGVQSAIALGNPANSELYVLFGKMDAEVEFPTHIHPDDRITTVISGVMHYGTGEQSDRSLALSYPAGSVVYTPAGTPHYMWTEDKQTIMQETGRGPTGLKFTSNEVKQL